MEDNTVVHQPFFPPVMPLQRLMAGRYACVRVVALALLKGEKGDFTCRWADPPIIPTPLASAGPTGIIFFSTSSMIPCTIFKVLKKSSTGPGLKMMLIEWEEMEANTSPCWRPMLRACELNNKLLLAWNQSSTKTASITAESDTEQIQTYCFNSLVISVIL